MIQHFGQIDFALACRLGELTQNEMRVLMYLYVCRNEQTGQCNPYRKTIISDIKIEKGNLSKAITGLESKGWILENADGNFTLFDASEIPEKVVEVTTKKVVDSTTKVVSLTTKVVEVTTKSCRSNNSHIKELNIEKNKERTKKEHPSETDAGALVKPKTNKPKTEPDDPAFKSFRSRLWEFQKQYAEIPDRERIIAINVAIKKLWIISDGNADICEQVHAFLQADWTERRTPVLWTEVYKNFNFNLKRMKENENGTIQPNKPKFTEREKRKITEFNTISEIRKRRQLQGRNAADR